MTTRQIFTAAAVLLTCNLVMAIEEPEFTVLRESDDYEIRQYDAYLIAEVDVTGDFASSGNRAFRILAGYIFGENRAPNGGSEKMQMTAPVESRILSGADAQDPGEGTGMAMTAPVISSGTDNGSYTYAFVMESKYSMDTLPLPVNDQIRITRVVPRLMAVRKYSGRWTESNYRQNEQSLLDALSRDGVMAAGEPVLARYNAPFTPWFMRRNEVMIEIKTDALALASHEEPGG